MDADGQVAPIDAFERTLCAAITGPVPHWSAGSDRAAIARCIDTARYHGVLPLLDAALGSSGADHGWPVEIVAAALRATVAQGLHESAYRAEIPRVLAALVAVDAKPLLLKGSALAYSHYPDPALRPRADTDLLIHPERRAQAARALEALGYTKGEGVEGEFVSYQATWSRHEAHGAAHHLDVHWRVNNSQMLARTLEYDELAARAVALPMLGPHAFAPAPVDALLFACVHLAGHVNAPFAIDDIVARDHLRLIWLYDIGLLVRSMTAAECDEFVARACAKRITAICRDALLRTQERLAVPIPPEMLEALAPAGAVEPSARYLTGGRARQMVGDLLALPSWSARGRWLRETAFPSEAYMRSKYPDMPGAWLPRLCARRGLAGVARLIVGRGAHREH